MTPEPTTDISAGPNRLTGAWAQTVRASAGPVPLWIGGSQRQGESGDVRLVSDPWDPTVSVGQCHWLTERQLPLVLGAAEAGFETFRKRGLAERAAILRGLSERLKTHEDHLARLITLEAGKPITLARQEVRRAVQLAEAYAGAVWQQPGLLVETEDGRSARVAYFPVGPVLAITPYNFPLNLVLHKLCPAIASGCSTVIKPAVQTPLTALLLAQLAVEAGYEAISVAPCQNDLAQAMLTSPVFRKLSFTGSAAVGWHLQSLAVRKSVTLELGGNAAVVIEDAPPEALAAIAERVAFGAFAYAGQVCIAVQRVLVQEALYEEFTAHFKAAVRALKVGDPKDERTVVGPLIDARQLSRARELIRDAVVQGGNVVYGGNAYNLYTLNPTVLDRVKPAMRVASEEAFAPVATLERYATFDEALARVNDSPFGLQAGVYTQSHAQAERAFAGLDVGGVIVNDIPTYRSDRLPYGGVKDSGLGREGVLAALAEYTVTKTLVQS